MINFYPVHLQPEAHFYCSFQRIINKRHYLYFSGRFIDRLKVQYQWKLVNRFSWTWKVYFPVLKFIRISIWSNILSTNIDFILFYLPTRIDEIAITFYIKFHLKKKESLAKRKKSILNTLEKHKSSVCLLINSHNFHTNFTICFVNLSDFYFPLFHIYANSQR